MHLTYVGPTAVARLVLVNGEGGAWRSADLLPQYALASSRLQLGKPAGEVLGVGRDVKR